MTHRTEEPPRTPIERATMTVVRQMNRQIEIASAVHHLNEYEFRKILAGYFERLSEREWWEVLALNQPRP